MATTRASLTLFLFLLFSFILQTSGATGTPVPCGPGATGDCYDKPEALKLKIIAFIAILITSMIGVSLPLVSRSVPALQPDRDLFVLVRAFASGVILATGYMHVLPDSFDCLRSPCLPEKPWRKFPFTTFVAMLSAVMTLMIDSFALSYYKKFNSSGRGETSTRITVSEDSCKSGHYHAIGGIEDEEPTEQLSRNRIVAQVLELGIVVHSVVIGLSLGASQNPCIIKPLVAALCFHQLFEGMGLGGCILQAEYGNKMNAIMVFFFSTTTPFGIALGIHLVLYMCFNKNFCDQAEYGNKMNAIMVFFFSTTTPFGIALGIGLSNVYSDNSPTSLIVVGLLNACSAGLLNYMALVDLLAADFLGPKLQSSVKLQLLAYLAVLLGAGGMSVMAKWA